MTENRIKPRKPGQKHFTGQNDQAPTIVVFTCYFKWCYFEEKNLKIA